MHHPQYNHEQVQALIAKYRIYNNMEALVQLGTSYPQFQKPIADIVMSYGKRAEAVNTRLKKVGLEDHII